MTETVTATPENSNEGAATSTTASESTPAQTTLTTDTPSETSTAAASEAQNQEQTQTEGAPEKYEFKAPEGKELDSKVLAEFEGIARELNLPQESAQKFIDKIAPLIEARQQEAMDTARTDWANQTKADPELGGAKLDANVAVAKKALDQFGTPELKTLLNESGLGNHPEIIRMLFKAGKAISEDSFVAGRQTTQAPTSAAKALYPSSK